MSKHTRATRPLDFLQGLKQNWRIDLVSGFILFLIALPLSIGIALASGAPPTAGLLAAAVGGLIGALLGGSYVTINGPAAGLIVIVVMSIQELGKGNLLHGFRLTLAATMVAGALQFVMGILGGGVLGLSFPTAVIHGMLVAIGIIIMSKQFHTLMGMSPQSKSILGMLGEIPHSLGNMNYEIAIIGFAALAVIIVLSRTRAKWLSRVPAPLAAAVVGIVLGGMFDLEHQHTVHFFSRDSEVGPNFLLSIPSNLKDAFIFPDFSEIWTFTSIKMIVMIALVASIESVLSAYAVDKLDPFRRTSNLNRDLWSKGICNLICGAIGGLPIIAEIVRSTANIANGARTRWSNFFHGAFLFLFVALVPELLHRIPLAALAAILIVVGYRLANPKNFVHVWHTGWDQMLVFLTTIGLTLTEDLLVGVIAGLVLEFALNAIRVKGFASLFRLRKNVTMGESDVTIMLESPLVSTNFVALKKVLDAIPHSHSAALDVSKVPFIDSTVREYFEKYQEDFKGRGRSLDLLGHERHARHARKVKKH